MTAGEAQAKTGWVAGCQTERGRGRGEEAEEASRTMQRGRLCPVRLALQQRVVGGAPVAVAQRLHLRPLHRRAVGHHILQGFRVLGFKVLGYRGIGYRGIGDYNSGA